ncbi:unnamed protein product [Microthlaspi erraticum]|uniref:Uncharacterized protein n=1 Tax=Microthlaspi erraticum TaxID=1685480 RepID=A0A6D2HFM4_9BRAS|nr:unnamed protein product [Microthlaspi erraticum]
MVLTEAEILEVKAELIRVKEGSELDAEHEKELEEKMTEYAEKKKVMGQLHNAMLKMLKKSVVKNQAHEGKGKY